MNARSEGDECGWAHGVEEPEGIAAHYVEGAGASTHSHSECIVVRSRAFMNNPGLVQYAGSRMEQTSKGA